MAESDNKRPANSRATAARILAAWLQSGEIPARMLEGVEADRAFVTELVHGVVRWHRPLTWIRSRFARRKPPHPVEAVLLVGLYQLLMMDHVQEFAAVHETVEAAKMEAGAGSGRFVNAVLRRVQAEGRKTLLDALAKRPPAVRLSHPDTLFERWTNHFGESRAIALCEWNNRRPDVVVRVNTARVAFDDGVAAFRKAGVEIEPHPADPSRFLVIPRGASVSALPGFAEGWFYVQDPSTAVAPDLLAATPGERVLDACAAPGGKTAILAEAMRGEGTLVAMDVSADRIATLRKNLGRLGWNAARVVEAHAAKPAQVSDALAAAGAPAQFDAILLDVPCTNTGVIRRRPDARWRFSPRRLEKACYMQKAILAGAASFLAPGGRLVYSTCSIEPDENERQIEAWLAAHPEFSLVATRNLFPPESGTDGAFAALLRKI